MKLSKSLIEIKVSQGHDSHQLNQLLRFKVPSQTESVAIEVHNEQYMWLTYMIHDPNKKLRGQFIKAYTPQPIIIHEKQEESSPYTFYGPIDQGHWTIDISIIAREEVKANDTWCTFTISLNESEKNRKPDLYNWQLPESQLLNVDDAIIFNDQCGWYKGDFHTHTTFSDGKMSREENMLSAKNQNLDFFVATDHNLIPTSWFDRTDILVIPGVEVTSPILGHFNVISTNKSPFANHRLENMFSEEGMKQLLMEDYGDALISMNHPFLKHFHWKVMDTPLEIIDSIEIWNDPTFPENIQATEMALQCWNLLLNEGYRITGIGGSDSHLKPDETHEGSDIPSLIGDPGTYVYCEALSASQIVKNVKDGHVIVSRGEWIQFHLDEWIAGDTCPMKKGTVNASVNTNEPIYFQWIVDGQVIKKDVGHQSEWEFDFRDDDYHWVRVDVRREDDSLYGFTNPIYFGEKTPQIKTWGPILDRMNV